jgi:hypothetical protein
MPTSVTGVIPTAEEFNDLVTQEELTAAIDNLSSELSASSGGTLIGTTAGTVEERFVENEERTVHILAPSATDPTTASEGDQYFNTTSSIYKVYRSGAWIASDAANLIVSLGSPDGYKFIGEVDSISALRSIEPSTALQKIKVRGYYSGTTIGGGEFYYDSTDSTSADDGGSCIVNSNGNRWKRIFNEYISIKFFGVLGDLVADDTITLKNALIASRIQKLKLLIDTPVNYNCATVDKPIPLMSGDYIEFTQNGLLSTSTCCLPILYAINCTKIRIKNLRFSFLGTIPVSLPAANSTFVATLQTQAGVTGMPGFETMSCLLFWLCTDVFIENPRFVSQNTSSVMNLIPLCIDTLRNTGFTVTNAFFDGIVHGLVGSGSHDLYIDAHCSCRGNPNQTTSAYIPPGHVVYISPSTASLLATNINITVDEWNAVEPADSYDQSASTVSMKYIEGSTAKITSNFSQGILNTCNIKSATIDLMYDGSNSIHYAYGSVRFLGDTSSLNGGYCMQDCVIRGKLILPTSQVGYLEFGQYTTGSIIGLLNNLIDFELKTSATSLASPAIILCGNKNTIKLKFEAELISSGIPFPINIYSTGKANMIDIKAIFADGFSPTMRCAAASLSGNNINTEIIKTGKLVNYKTGMQDITEGISEQVSPVSGSVAFSSGITIPAGSVLLGVTTVVTSTLGGTATTYSVGDGTTANKYGITVAGSQSGLNVGKTTSATIIGNLATATTIYITPNGGTFDGTGTLKITVNYRYFSSSTEV